MIKDAICRVLALFVAFQSIRGALQHWFDLAAREAQRGFAAADAFGRANLRADIGGIFLIIGLFAVLAAGRRSSQWALAAILSIACAIAGRLISGSLDGFGPREINAMVSEIAGIALLLPGWWVWRKSMPEGL